MMDLDLRDSQGWPTTAHVTLAHLRYYRTRTTYRGVTHPAPVAEAADALADALRAFVGTE